MCKRTRPTNLTLDDLTAKVIKRGSVADGPVDCILGVMRQAAEVGYLLHTLDGVFVRAIEELGKEGQTNPYVKDELRFWRSVTNLQLQFHNDVFENDVAEWFAPALEEKATRREGAA